MTKTEMRKLAKQSTCHGFFDHGAKLSANCPACKKRIQVDYSIHSRDSKGRAMSKTAQIHAEMFEHLKWDCEAQR
jgi:hypothetical protein